AWPRRVFSLVSAPLHRRSIRKEGKRRWKQEASGGLHDWPQTGALQIVEQVDARQLGKRLLRRLQIGLLLAELGDGTSIVQVRQIGHVGLVDQLALIATGVERVQLGKARAHR